MLVIKKVNRIIKFINSFEENKAINNTLLEKLNDNGVFFIDNNNDFVVLPRFYLLMNPTRIA